MADEIDRANQRAQELLDDALATKRRAHRPEPQGCCLAPRCGEEFATTDNARLFCNAACANEYAKYNA